MASPHVYGLPFLFTQKPHVVAMFPCFFASHSLFASIGGRRLAGTVKPTSYAFPKKKNASKGEKIDDILTWMLIRRIQQDRSKCKRC
jgi:hypothetical protein